MTTRRLLQITLSCVAAVMSCFTMWTMNPYNDFRRFGMLADTILTLCVFCLPVVIWEMFWRHNSKSLRVRLGISTFRIIIFLPLNVWSGIACFKLYEFVMSIIGATNYWLPTIYQQNAVGIAVGFLVFVFACNLFEKSVESQ